MPAKLVVGVFTSELAEQMDDAASTTTKAYAHLRHLRHMEKGFDSSQSLPAMTEGETIGGEKAKEKDKKMSAEILIIRPILRFLQLLCENHNAELQVSAMWCVSLKKYGLGSLTKPVLIVCGVWLVISFLVQWREVGMFLISSSVRSF